MKGHKMILGPEAPDNIEDDVQRAFGGDPDALFNLANDLGRAPVSEVREVLYRVAIERGVLGAWLNLGHMLDEDGRQSEAVDCHLQAHEEGDPMAAFALGQAFANLGDLENARAWFERSVAHPATPLRLAVVLEGLGLGEQAAVVLESAVQANAEAAVGWVLRGRVTGAEAVALLESHLDRGEIDVAVPLAILYEGEGEGRVEEAVALLRRGVDAGEPHAWHNLALLLWEAGERDEALQLWEGASAAGDEMARAALASVRRDARRRRAVVSALVLVGGVLVGRARSRRNVWAFRVISGIERDASTAAPESVPE